MADHRINIKVETCTECNGTAKVHYPQDTNPVTCPKCKGQGFTDRQEWDEEGILPIEYRLVTCAISEWETIPEYYKVYMQGEDQYGNLIKVQIECDTIAFALGLDTNAYLYQAFTYLFRCFRKGNTKENIRKAIHFMGMWTKRGEIEHKGTEQ